MSLQVNDAVYYTFLIGDELENLYGRVVAVKNDVIYVCRFGSEDIDLLNVDTNHVARAGYYKRIFFRWVLIYDSGSADDLPFEEL